MSCQTLGKVGRILSRSTPDIVRGATFSMVTYLAESQANGELCHAGFSGFVGATAFFPGSDATVAVVGTLEGSEDLGRVRFAAATADTLAMEAGAPSSFEQHFVDDSGLTILQFQDALNIVDQYF